LRQGVEERLAATLGACGIPPAATEALAPEPALTGFAPDPPGTLRVRRGVRIRAVPPGTNLAATATGLWQQGGCQVSQTSTPFGGTLVAQDPAGYILVLTTGDGGAPSMLLVSSPPGPARDLGLVVGVIVGAVLGPVGTCASTTALNGPSDSTVLKLWAWLPFLLVVGGLLLVSPATRRFGTGLLIGGAATGIAVSGLCTAILA
jgi:hypothetical protein